MAVISAAVMGTIGLLFSLFLVIAKKRFTVEIDPRVERVESLLPGVNCGGCGFATCEAYAEAVVTGKAGVDLCVVGGADTAREVAEVMGVAVAEEDREKLVAVVFCQGDRDASRFPGVYAGIRDCAVALASQDTAKRCTYGCVGLGSCVRACPFGAIRMSERGLPVVDAEKCTACGKCVIACPRNLIELHPVSHEVFVYCRSRDPGAVARKVCGKSCIACRICIRAAEKDGNPDAVRLEGNLAVVATDGYSAKPEYGEKCPTGAWAVGRNVVNRERVTAYTGEREREPVKDLEEG